ncbi:MAG: MCE family protein [Bacteroidales bacterium]|nr:MCE family protein [Bacteroidales bacterium]
MEKFRLTRMQAIGLFVLLTLIATFAVINFLRGEDIFNRSNSYYAVYDQVDGLTVTGPVYLRGYKVGMVEDITYNPQQNNFEVELKVKSQFEIPANSTAEVYSADIMGARAVRINIGDSEQILESGDTLASAIQADMISTVMGQIEPLKEQAVELMATMNRTLESVDKLLDSTSRAEIQSSLKHLNSTLANAASLSRTLDNISPELVEIVKNLEVLSKGLGESTDEIKGSLENVNAITSSLSKAELDKTIESLRNLSEKLQDPNGSVGKLLSTDSLHNAVNTLINDVDKLVKGISENPKKYIKVSVF